MEIENKITKKNNKALIDEITFKMKYLPCIFIFPFKFVFNQEIV